DVLPHAFVGQERLPGVIAPAEGFLIGDHVVDAVVAWPAEPEAPAAHFLDREPVAEPPLAVAVARGEVMERQHLARPPAQLAGTGLPLLAAAGWLVRFEFLVRGHRGGSRDGLSRPSGLGRGSCTPDAPRTFSSVIILRAKRSRRLLATARQVGRVR